MISVEKEKLPSYEVILRDSYPSVESFSGHVCLVIYSEVDSRDYRSMDGSTSHVSSSVNDMGIVVEMVTSALLEDLLVMAKRTTRCSWQVITAPRCGEA